MQVKLKHNTKHANAESSQLNKKYNQVVLKMWHSCIM